MGKKISCLTFLLLSAVLIQGTAMGAFNPNTDSSLAGYWPLDDGSGTTAVDASGKGNDGTLMNGPVWVAGYLGGGLQFDGTDDYVDCGNDPVFDITQQVTLALWVKPQDIGNSEDNEWLGKGDHAYCIKGYRSGNTIEFFIYDGEWYSAIPEVGAAFNDTWHHVAGTYDGSTLRTYIDGEPSTTLAHAGRIASATHNVNIARNSENTSRFAKAIIDDARIYSRALTQDEIKALMTGGIDPALATNPQPDNGATDVFRTPVLSWDAGDFAATHDVYFGASLDAVTNAGRSAPGAVLLGKDQTDTTFNPGRLAFDTVYYWRVDEVNAPSAGGTVHKGDIWQFTTEPYSIAITDVNATADSSYDTTSVASKTVDGSGLDANTDTHGTAASDMWISGMTSLPHWIQYSFDKVYKLDQMLVWNSNQMMEGLFGLGAKSVLVQVSIDGTTWTDLGTFQFTKAPGNITCAADTKVPFNGAAAKSVKLNITSNWGGLFQQASLSEVRFYAIPVAAREPSPANAAANLHPQVAMSWRAGREAGSHEVYVGSDANAVAASTTPTATVTEAKYDAALGLGQTYYWKVVEVNQATDPAGWPSDVWSFSTGTYINFDDFEGYTNNSPKRVFQTWIDGSGFSPDEYFPNGNSGNGTGSLVGNDPQLGDIMELTYTYAGKQSMPLFYDNSTGSKISEAIRTLDPAKDTTDWSKYGLTTFILWFKGDAANGAAPVYVKINNTKKVYGVAAATTSTFWEPFQIDLSTIPAADLKAVKTITIGVGDGSAAGSGTILVDEIRLYAVAPAIPVPSDPGTTGLIAYYAMNGDVQDGSGNGNNGTIVGEPSYVDGMTGFGKALAFDGVNDCVDLGNKAVFNPTGSFSVSLWANITAWGTGWGHVMIGNRGESAIGWQIRRHSSTSLCFTTRGVDQDDTASVMTPPQNKWLNIVCVYDDAAGTKTIYIDGHQDKVVNTTAGKHVAATTLNTFIGARAAAGNTPEAFFTGMLDEIRLFNRALTAGEAAYLAGDR